MRRKETEKVDRTDIEERLKSGAENMKVFLADEMLEKLVDYIYLLHKWNATYNLTALKNPGDMLTHHVLDSLSVVPFLVKSRNIEMNMVAKSYLLISNNILHNHRYYHS